LKFWEEQWPVIEKLTVLAVKKDWEDWLEQFCVSLSFIFTSAKPFALSSPLLIKGEGNYEYLEFDHVSDI
jgi:hypothetical protein